MERELNIEVPGIFMKSFVKSLNIGYIPVSIYVGDSPKEQNIWSIGLTNNIQKVKQMFFSFMVIIMTLKL